MTDYVGIRVHDLKENMDKSHIVKAFREQKIDTCKVKTFKDNKTEKRMGCVQFKSHEDAKKAMDLGTIKVGEEQLTLTTCCRCRGHDDATVQNSMCPPTIVSNGNNNSNGQSTARIGSIPHPPSSFNSIADSMCPATDGATVSSARRSMTGVGGENGRAGNTVFGSTNVVDTPFVMLPPTNGLDFTFPNGGFDVEPEKAEKTRSVEVPCVETAADWFGSTNKTDGNGADKRSGKKGKKLKNKKKAQEKEKNNDNNDDKKKNCSTQNNKALKNKKKGKKQVEKIPDQAFETSGNNHKNGKRNGRKTEQNKKMCSGEENRFCKKATAYTYSDAEDEKPLKRSLKNRQA